MENQTENVEVVEVVADLPMPSKFAKFKAYAKSFAVPVGVVGLGLVSQSAFAVDTTPNFTSLVSEAKANMEQGLAGALAVLGTGITIVGVFKGYSYIKQGVKKS